MKVLVYFLPNANETFWRTIWYTSIQLHFTQPLLQQHKVNFLLPSILLILYIIYNKFIYSLTLNFMPLKLETFLFNSNTIISFPGFGLTWVFRIKWWTVTTGVWIIGPSFTTLVMAPDSFVMRILLTCQRIIE